jgi:hypothetical protein
MQTPHMDSGRILISHQPTEVSPREHEGWTKEGTSLNEHSTEGKDQV